MPTNIQISKLTDRELSALYWKEVEGAHNHDAIDAMAAGNRLPPVPDKEFWQMLDELSGDYDCRKQGDPNKFWAFVAEHIMQGKSDSPSAAFRRAVLEAWLTWKQQTAVTEGDKS